MLITEKTSPRMVIAAALTRAPQHMAIMMAKEAALAVEGGDYQEATTFATAGSLFAALGPSGHEKAMALEPDMVGPALAHACTLMAIPPAVYIAILTTHPQGERR